MKEVAMATTMRGTHLKTERIIAEGGTEWQALHHQLGRLSNIPVETVGNCVSDKQRHPLSIVVVGGVEHAHAAHLEVGHDSHLEFFRRCNHHFLVSRPRPATKAKITANRSVVALRVVPEGEGFPIG